MQNQKRSLRSELGNTNRDLEKEKDPEKETKIGGKPVMNDVLEIKWVHGLR